MRGDMFLIGEITLYDSFRLLTPVGIQDSYFRRLYTDYYNKLKTNKKKFHVSLGVNKLVLIFKAYIYVLDNVHMSGYVL